MAFWDRISSRGNVEDRRGMAPAAVGGLSLTGLALVLLFNMLSGGDLGEVINQLPVTSIEKPPSNSSEFEGEDSYERFASTVLGSNNEYWTKSASTIGKSYTPPTLVLFRTATTSSCGNATSQVGPHYCPLDNTIYLDETFFDELTNRLGAQGGDVAEAYVIAHEVGHHVQNDFGIMSAMQQQQQFDPSAQNDLSIKLELQADCFAGLWARSVQELQVLEPGEIKEAMDAAASVGDDRIQERVTGYTNPETWTHGSSEQRVEWFTKGFQTGNYEACNTFNN